MIGTEVDMNERQSIAVFDRPFSPSPSVCHSFLLLTSDSHRGLDFMISKISVIVMK